MPLQLANEVTATIGERPREPGNDADGPGSSAASPHPATGILKPDSHVHRFRRFTLIETDNPRILRHLWISPPSSDVPTFSLQTDADSGNSRLPGGAEDTEESPPDTREHGNSLAEGNILLSLAMPFTPSIPKEIQALIVEGLWPSNHRQAREQHFTPILATSVIRQFAPDESSIFLYPPPFAIVRAVMQHEQHFWADPRTATTEIDPDHTVLIGDFGLGSDAPIALDYKKDEQNPVVIRLRWAKEGNHWVELAPDLTTFARYFRRL